MSPSALPKDTLYVPHRSIHLLDLDVIVLVEVHVHTVARAFVVRDDVQTVVRPVELDADGLPVADALREDHDRERVEQLLLNGAVEWPRAIRGRVPDRHQVVLRRVVQLELHLPLRDTLLDLLETDVDDLQDVRT